MGIAELISLLSGVALFLFGMTLMGDGLKKVAGSKLEIILYNMTSNPLKGILLGTGVTTVIQSSSATSVMVVGFVNSGMMKVRQAIGVIMGAILGTSITGWIICLSEIKGGSGWVDLLSTATLTGIVAIVGIILRMFSKKLTTRHVGDIMMGFAVLMFGMSVMSGAVSGLKEGVFVDVMTSFSNPFLGILAGCVMTCVIQSASASVGIIQALASAGIISFGSALPLVMGISIGAAVPVIISAVGASVDGKRSAFSYLFTNTVSTVILSAIFYTLNAFLKFDFLDAPQTAVGVAAINTVFRLITVLLFAPAIPLMEKLMKCLFRDSPEELADAAQIERLEERFIEHPALAIEQSRLTLNSMAQNARENLERSISLIDDYSEESFKKVQLKENVIDRYEDELGTYLVKINQKELIHDQNIEISKFLHTISDFERIGDHAVNISEVASEIHEKKLEFSPEAKKEMDMLANAIKEILRISVDAFVNEDLDMAYRVEPLEELVDNLCDEAKLNHVKRVQTGDCTLNQGFVFNDLLTNFERVADHCSNIAVAMIELESDSFDTHEYLNSLKEARTVNFDTYFEEYKNTYKFD